MKPAPFWQTWGLAMNDWIHELRRYPIEQVAKALGLTVGRGNRFTECPACHHVFKSKRSGCTIFDNRWHCHKCEKGGDVVDLVAVVAIGKTLHGATSEEYEATRAEAALRGLVDGKAGATITPRPRVAPKPLPAPETKPSAEVLAEELAALQEAMRDDGRIAICTFSHVTQTTPTRKDLTWPDLVDFATTFQPTTANVKDDLPLWSATIYRPETTRGKAGVLAVSCLALDYDHGATFDEGCAHWQDYQFVAHTSWSHTEKEHRYRIIVPLTSPIPASQYAKLWDWAWKKTGGKIDEQPKDTSRGWFVPALRPDKPRETFVNNDKGTPFLDWSQLPDQEEPMPLEEVEEMADDETPTPETDPGDPWPPMDLVPAEWLTGPKPKREYLLKRDAADPKQEGQRRWIGWLPRGKVAMLAAAGGTGKTMALVQLAACVATGHRWFGYQPQSRTGRILLALGEEPPEEVAGRLSRATDEIINELTEELKRRGKGKLTEDDKQKVQLVRERICERIVPWPLAGVPGVGLTDREGKPTEPLKALRRHLKEQGPWDLVILDPMSRFMGPDTERDNALATRFVAALESLVDVPGRPTVMVAHHVSQSAYQAGAIDQTASRGVTGLVDGVRWQAVMAQEKDDQKLLRLKLAKTNYSAAAPEIHLEFNDNGVLRLVPEEDVEKRNNDAADAKEDAAAEKAARKTARKEARKEARAKRKEAKAKSSAKPLCAS